MNETTTKTTDQRPCRTVRSLDGRDIEVEDPPDNGQLVPVPMQQQNKARFTTIATALASATEKCKMAVANAVDNRGAFPNADAVILTAREAFSGTGLAINSCGTKALLDTILTTEGKEWTLIETAFQLMHESGESLEVARFQSPVLFEKGVTIPNAFRIAKTRALADYLRELLLMPKERCKVAVDGGPEEKEKRAAAAAAKRAQAQQPAAPAPAATTTTAPVTVPTAKATPAPTATVTAAAPTTPTLKIETQNQLTSLREELFGLMGLGADESTKNAKWREILAKRNVNTTRDLTEEQGIALATGLKTKIDSLRKEIQATGHPFPGNGN